MSIKLQDFKSNLKNVVRSNRFLALFTGEISTPDILELKFLISKASLPKQDITGPIVRYRGTSITLDGDLKKEPIILTFINDSEWKARGFVENWLDSIVSHEETSNERKDTIDYRFGSQLQLQQLGKDGSDILAIYTFFDVVPLDYTEIELDQSAENTIEEFSASFHYSTWVRS